jgi:hypothetical protein
MILFINDVKKDIYELKSIMKKFERELDDVEKLTLQKQIDSLKQIAEDLEQGGECIIEER